MYKTLKHINIIVLFVILIVVQFSCREDEYPETTTKFIVHKIVLNKKRGMDIYYAVPIERKDLNLNSTWFVDSVDKFNVGDTLSFHLHH